MTSVRGNAKGERSGGTKWFVYKKGEDERGKRARANLCTKGEKKREKESEGGSCTFRGRWSMGWGGGGGRRGEEVNSIPVQASRETNGLTE